MIDIRAKILGILGDVAPDADLGGLDGGADLRDELDIDSMDFLNVVVGVHEALGVDIPEADYPRIGTLDAMVAYVRDALTTAGSKEVTT